MPYFYGTVTTKIDVKIRCVEYDLVHQTSGIQHIQKLFCRLNISYNGTSYTRQNVRYKCHNTIYYVWNVYFSFQYVTCTLLRNRHKIINKIRQNKLKLTKKIKQKENPIKLCLTNPS